MWSDMIPIHRFVCLCALGQWIGIKPDVSKISPRVTVCLASFFAPLLARSSVGVGSVLSSSSGEVTVFSPFILSTAACIYAKFNQGSTPLPLYLLLSILLSFRIGTCLQCALTNHLSRSKFRLLVTAMGDQNRALSRYQCQSIIPCPFLSTQFILLMFIFHRRRLSRLRSSHTPLSNTTVLLLS